MVKRMKWDGKFMISKISKITLIHSLKQALENEYEDDNETDITFHMPKNTEKVRFYFRGEKNAKVVGQLATSQGFKFYSDRLYTE